MAQHDRGGDAARQERDLGVPVLGGQARLPLQPVAGRRSRIGDDLLSRGVQGHRAARAGQCGAAVCDLVQDGLALAAEMGVVELLAASDERAPDRRRGLVPSLVELDREDDRRPVLVGEQARGSLPDRARVERAAGVGRVDGDPAPPRLRLDRPAPVDELADVGDRVAHAVPAVSPPLEEHRLVEVHAARRVDREEREPAQVGPAVSRRPAPGRRLGGILDRLREVGVHVELLANAGEVGGERARRRLRQADTTVRSHVVPIGRTAFFAGARRALRDPLRGARGGTLGSAAFNPMRPGPVRGPAPVVFRDSQHWCRCSVPQICTQRLWRRRRPRSSPERGEPIASPYGGGSRGNPGFPRA